MDKLYDHFSYAGWWFTAIIAAVCVVKYFVRRR
jgi:hypothetical protein